MVAELTRMKRRRRRMMMMTVNIIKYLNCGNCWCW